MTPTPKEPEVQRYSLTVTDEAVSVALDDDGDLVSYDDYAKVRAERDALHALCQQHAQKIGWLTAERDAAAREREDDHALIERQAALLTGVVNAIRGNPAPLSKHSHHDAVELAQELVNVRYQRKPLPERGGYVCDTNGVIDTNTIATMREVSYLHDEAVSAVASLIRSHESLRARLAAVEAERDAWRQSSDEYKYDVVHLRARLAACEQRIAQYEARDNTRRTADDQIIASVQKHLAAVATLHGVPEANFGNPTPTQPNAGGEGE